MYNLCSKDEAYNRKNRLTLKNDVIFKELFTRKGNEIFLKDFLSSLLKLDIIEIEVMKEAELSKFDLYNKTGVIDIKAKINNGTYIDIEMQRRNDKDIIERTCFYSSKLISSQLKEGESYKKLKPVIVISILDYNFL